MQRVRGLRRVDDREVGGRQDGAGTRGGGATLMPLQDASPSQKAFDSGGRGGKCGRVCSTHTLTHRQAHKLSGLLPGGKKQTLVPRSSALPRRHFLQAVRMKDRKSGRNPIRSPNAKNTFIKQSAIWREIPLE